MKKIILSAAAVFAFGFANAQEEVKESTGFGFSKGNIIVEGNLSFSMDKDETPVEEVKTNVFIFTPKAGYFVTDKIAVGVEVMVGSGKEETTDLIANNTDEETINSFGAGVFARYYFLDLGQRFKTYAEAGVGFGSTKWESNSVETQKDTNINFGIDLGMNYFVTENMAINFGLANVLGFGSTKSEFPGGGETTSSSINGNFNVFNNFFDTPTFGLTYKF
nr:OmpW family outer membrane protein [uncultured Flavobacterium sp.]